MSPDNILRVLNAHTSGSNKQLTTRYDCQNRGIKTVLTGSLLTIVGVVAAVILLLISMGNGLVLLTSLPALDTMEGHAAKVLLDVGVPITYSLFMGVFALCVMLFIMKKAERNVSTYMQNHLWLMATLSDGTRTPHNQYEKQCRADELSRPLWRWALLMHITLALSVWGIVSYLGAVNLPDWGELNQLAGQLPTGANAFFPLLSVNYTWVYPTLLVLTSLLPVGLWVLSFAQARTWVLLEGELDRMTPRYGLIDEGMQV